MPVVSPSRRIPEPRLPGDEFLPRAPQAPPKLFPETVRSPQAVQSAAVSLSNAAALTAQAHQMYLQLAENFAKLQSHNLAQQIRISSGQAVVPAPVSSPAPLPLKTPVFMDRKACLEFASGKIAAVLGSAFAHVDAYPTRVRLPEEPLMLCDRVMSVTGAPNSMKAGSCITEHDVLPNGWYLDAGRIPTCIAVEAG